MPLTVGYISAHLLTPQAELSDLTLTLVAFAHARGNILCSLHVEQPPTVPVAFQGLIEQVSREGIRTVLVPSLHHLGAVGQPLSIKEHLEHLIGGQVLITGYAP